jgi:hypothetical protein
MTIQIFVCDTAAALVQTLAEIQEMSAVVYQTPDANPETGDILRYLVKPPRSPGATLDSYAGKFLIVAIRPDD